jgi:hypothetical protein
VDVDGTRVARADDRLGGLARVAAARAQSGPRKQDEGRKGMSRPLTGVRLVLSQVVDTRVATVLRNAAAVLPGSANASSVESAAAAVSIVNSVP